MAPIDGNFLILDMGSAKVNDKADLVVRSENGQWTVDGKKVDWDMIERSEGMFHILSEGKSYRAKVINVDMEAKKVRLLINEKEYHVQVQSDRDVLLKKLGIEAGSGSSQNDIKAPMPGLILDVMAEPGQVIKKGDPVLVLEAMKMENILKAPGDGTIKSIAAKKGDTVAKNQVLVTFN